MDQPDGEKPSCSMCLGLLKDPVTVSCGHSFCGSCIQSHWDKEVEKGTRSCPQCQQQVLTQRPDPVRNVTLAEVVGDVATAIIISQPRHHFCVHPEPVIHVDGCCDDSCCDDGGCECGDCGCGDCGCDDCGCDDGGDCGCDDCGELLTCCFFCDD